MSGFSDMGFHRRIHATSRLDPLTRRPAAILNTLMRILHIVGTMSPDSGGPAEAVRMMVDYAPPNVTSESVSCDQPNAPCLASLPCTTHALGSTNPGFFHSPQLIPWLRANRSRFDGVIVHGLWTYPGYAAWRALAGHTPYAVFAHGMLDPYFKRRFPLKHAKKWLFWLSAQYWALRSAHRVLFTTAAERDLARHSFWLHHWKATLAPLGTEPPLPASPADHETLYTHAPELRGRRFLLFLGRIDPKKGCDLLIKAFVRLAHKHPEVDLVLAGPDPLNWKPQLIAIAERAGLANRVHWPGMLKGPAKTAAFDLCEAFILPSHQENFGIAVVEALAAGRPVLLSDKINIAPDIALDGCGLVSTDTLNGTIQLLEHWFALPSTERAKMSTQARATFAARYNMRSNTAAILRIFAPHRHHAEGR